MKKYRSLIAGLLLLMATNVLFAQSDNTVKKLAQSIRSHKSMEVDFTYQTIGDPKEKEEAKTAKAYFQDKAYKIIMDDQHTISDGTTTWHYIIEDEEVMVGNAAKEDNPYSILDELERDSSGLTATLDEKGKLKRLEINVDEGIKLVLNIIEMKFDNDYPDGFFCFDEKAYPNVDIIDMR